MAVATHMGFITALLLVVAPASMTGAAALEAGVSSEALPAAGVAPPEKAATPVPPPPPPPPRRFAWAPPSGSL